jgi:predicted DNA-binding WGR domain protein
MDLADGQTLLYRIDATRNMARFYALAVEPALFGDISLVRRWGRIGTSGRSKIELFDTSAEAAEALADLVRRKLGRGYRHHSAAGSAHGIVTPPGAKTAQAGFVEPGAPAE